MCEFCGCGTGRSERIGHVKARGKRVPVRIVAEARSADVHRAAAHASESRPSAAPAAPRELHR